MPPYSFGDDIDAIISSPDPFGLNEPTLTRQSDVEQYGHGVPAAYRTNIGLLESQQEMAEGKAMELLQRSLTQSAEVTPTQGIAAALLAAIPTFGGYMIGKSVGRPDLPEGYFEAGGTRAALGDTSSIGAGPGGLAGAQAGLVAGGGYLKGLEADKAQANKVYQAQAQIEANKAARLQGRADGLLQAGLAQQADIDMLPLREASQMRLQNNAAANTMDRQLQLLREKDSYEQLPPQVLEKAQDALGIPRDPNMTTDQLRVLTNAVAEQRRIVGQDTRLSGQNVTPPSINTKKQMENVILTKQIGGRYINQLEQLAEQDPSWLSRNVEKVLPATEFGALQQALKLYAVQIRNAREAGVMTEQDFSRYSDYLTIGSLDTVGSVLARMKELQAVTDLSAQATLTAAKLGRENVSEYEKFFGITGIPEITKNTQTTLQPGTGGRVELNQSSAFADQANSQTGLSPQQEATSRPLREQYSSALEYKKALEQYIANKKGTK